MCGGHEDHGCKHLEDSNTRVKHVMYNDQIAIAKIKIRVFVVSSVCKESNAKKPSKGCEV